MTRSTVLMLMLAATMAACRSTPDAGAPPPAQGASATGFWKTGQPADVGFDATALAALDTDFTGGKYRYVDAMFVTRDGVVVADTQYSHLYRAIYGSRDPKGGMYNYYDADWHPFYKGTRLHTMQSVTKTITAIVVGIARTRGEFPDIDQPVLGFFPGRSVANVDERKRKMTVRHLLTMTAGFDWDESKTAYTDPRNNCAVMEKSEDWIQYVLDRPMAAEPGATWVYNSGATQLLAGIFKQATGRDLAEYAQANLFTPLGITDFYWKRTPLGLPDTEGGLYLTSGDLAKFGRLWLDGGLWQGQRIVSAEWVAESVKPAIQATPAAKYGFKWWLFPYGAANQKMAWVMNGYGGQRLIVIPEYGISAVFTGWNIDENPPLPIREMVDRLVAAVAK